MITQFKITLPSRKNEKGMIQSIIQNEQLGFVKRTQQSEVRPILPGARQGMQKTGGAQVANGIAQAAGSHAQ